MQNHFLRLKFSEIIRLFLRDPDDLWKPVKYADLEGEYYIYAFTYSNDFVPELVLDLTEEEQEMTIADFLKELAFFVFEIGDLFFDLSVEVKSDKIILRDLPLTYSHLINSGEEDQTKIESFE